MTKLYYKRKEVKSHVKTVNGKKIKIKKFFRKDTPDKDSINWGRLGLGVAGLALTNPNPLRRAIGKQVGKGLKNIDKQIGKTNRNYVAKIRKAARKAERTGEVDPILQKLEDRMAKIGVTQVSQELAAKQSKSPYLGMYRDALMQARTGNPNAYAPDGITQEALNNANKKLKRQSKRKIYEENRRARAAKPIMQTEYLLPGS